MKEKLWHNVDWLLQDVRYEEALGYEGVNFLSVEEVEARRNRAKRIAVGVRSFFPSTIVGVLSPRPVLLRLKRVRLGAPGRAKPRAGEGGKRKAGNIYGAERSKRVKGATVSRCRGGSMAKQEGKGRA